VWSPVYVDAMVLRERGSERVYALQDGNWNTTALIAASGVPGKATGDLIQRMVYNPYGEVFLLNPDWTEQLGTPLVPWQHLFQGLKFTEATGLGYVRNRDYSPTLGRFIMLDPIGFSAGDNNWYRFVGNGPVGRVDPLGLENGLQDIPNWGMGTGYMHHTSHALEVRFKCCNDNDNNRVRSIYEDLKNFKHFDHLNSSTVRVAGEKANFKLNRFLGAFPSAAEILNSIDVALSSDETNYTVMAVTLGDHPLVGVRKWSVEQLCAGKESIIRIKTEAYERPRTLYGVELNDVGQQLFGAEIAKEMWARYLTNIAEDLVRQGGRFDRGTLVYKERYGKLGDSDNPFRKDLPYKLQADYHPLSRP
jgi:RHS repeat-associated protein